MPSAGCGIRRARCGAAGELPELADRLQISRHTVSDHLKNIYRKLNINSRAEAALEAVRLGLVAGT